MVKCEKVWLYISKTQENKLKCILKVIREFNKMTGYCMSKNQTENNKKNITKEKEPFIIITKP